MKKILSAFAHRSAVANNEHGVVAVLVAIMAVLLIGMAAFSVDLGIAYASKRQLSVTADAAALAGAQAAGKQYPVGTPCTSAIAASLLPDARTAAVEVYNAQLPKGSDGDPTVTVSCAGANALDIKVDDSATHATAFGGVFNVDTMHPGANATARVSGSPAYTGVRPFAMCLDDVSTVRPLPEAAKTTTKQTEFAFNPTGTKVGTIICGGLPPGNWGIVDFDGGSNPTGDIQDWTQNGYNGSFPVFPIPMPGDPGANFNASTIQSAMDSIVGKVVLMPVASKWQESGGNQATFTAEGLAAVKFCGWYVSPKKNATSDCWDESLLSGLPQTIDLVIQWRQVDWVTSYGGPGGPNSACNLGSDKLCIPAVRLYE